MNLETFKARARRKLELSPSPVPPVKETPENPSAPQSSESSNTAMTPSDPDNRDKPSSPDAGPTDDKFAAALRHSSAQPLRGDKSTSSRGSSVASSYQSLVGSPADRTAPLAGDSQPADPLPSNASPANSLSAGSLAAEPYGEERRESSSEAKLEQLRSLLLGETTQNQQQQVDVVYQRNQAGINALRRDVDARLSDLTHYVEQLEQSILNGIESHQGELSADTEERLAQHDQRLSDLDYRLSGTLETIRAETAERLEANQQLMQEQIASVNSRTDRLVSAVTERLERSMAEMQGQISHDLNNQSQSLLGDSESTLSTMEARVTQRAEVLIEDKLSRMNTDQSLDLTSLRQLLANNTDTIRDELRIQTEEQQTNLVVYRRDLEQQLSAAVKEMKRSTVTHEELSALLSRLADRVQQL